MQVAQESCNDVVLCNQAFKNLHALSEIKKVPLFDNFAKALFDCNSHRGHDTIV